MKWAMDFSLVENEVAVMNLGFEPDSDCFRSAVLLIAALVVGHNVRTLTEYTGYSERWLVPRISRLRQAGVWGKRGETIADWDDPVSGDEAFIADVLVAEGLLKRKSRKLGRATRVAKGGR